ncbi:hypothetical protein KKF55_05625 [Patescibacteria group bacterium]|nr:hypothetical protein [Patescibacteria group bacterium]
MPEQINDLIDQIQDIDLDRHVGTPKEYISEQIRSSLEDARVKLGNILNDMDEPSKERVVNKLKGQGIMLIERGDQVEIMETSTTNKNRGNILKAAKAISHEAGSINEQINGVLGNVVTSANETPNTGDEEGAKTTENANAGDTTTNDEGTNGETPAETDVETDGVVLEPPPNSSSDTDSTRTTPSPLPPQTIIGGVVGFFAAPFKYAFAKDGLRKHAEKYIGANSKWLWEGFWGRVNKSFNWTEQKMDFLVGWLDFRKWFR